MRMEELNQARLLIVDDEERNVRLLRAVLERGGYSQIESTTDAREALAKAEAFAPDLVLLDLHMPYVNGFTVLEALKSLVDEDSYLPVLVLTADATPATKNKALSMGAKDFLTKPIDAVEVLLRIQNLLENRFLNRHLEARVRERTQDLERAQHEVLERLAQAAEFRDDDTGQHTRRVGDIAALVAARLGLDAARVDVIRRAAALHDVGKIAIPDAILLKPGKLTPEEFDQMKTHASVGALLLRDGRSDLVRTAEIIARTHHEKWDGTGYPNQLVGEEIPIEGRILSVVDVFDALTHERPYKKAWPVEDALAEIERQSGRQFDPQVVEAFVALPLENLVDDFADTRDLNGVPNGLVNA